MLRHLANARLAPKHSPLAEQRLVFWAKAAGGEAGAAREPENPDDRLGLIELSRTAPERAVRKIGRDTRTHLQFLNDAAGVDVNKLTEDEAGALAVKHVDVLQGEEPDLVRGTTREAVTRVLSADAGSEGSVLEASQEARAMLDDLEQVDWQDDAAIAAFYDRRAALLRRILKLPDETGGTPVNKTELVLQLRYLREVDVIMAERQERNEKRLSERREKALDGPGVSPMLDDLVTVDPRDAVEMGAFLTRHEAVLERLIAPRTFAECAQTIPYQRLDWVLNQHPELRARMEKIRAERQHAAFLELTTREVDVGELTEALSRTDMADDDAMGRVYAEHRDTVERVFRNNDTPIPTRYSGREALLWVVSNVPGMAAAVEAGREKAREGREYDVPGAQYMRHEDYMEVYRESLRADAGRADEVQDAMLENAPSAFQFRGKVYFDLDHPDNADPIKAGRTVAHELTHAATRAETRRNANFFAETRAELETAGHWQALSEAVRNVFGARGNTMPDDEILDEAMAIYAGGERHPYNRDGDPAEAASWRIHSILAGIRTSGEPPELAARLARVTAKVDENYDNVAGRLTGAVEENAGGNKLAAEFRESVRTNVDSFGEVQEEVSKQVGADASKYKTPGDVLGAVSNAEGVLDTFKRNVDRYRQAAKRAGGLQESEDLRSISAIEGFMGEQASDLASAKIWADALERWDRPANAGGLTPDQKQKFMNEWNFGPDEKTNREQVLKGLAEYVASIQAPLKMVQAFMNADRPAAQKAEDKSFWRLLRENVFGNGKQVEWVSWSDLVKIVGVFKEAIVTRWAEGKDRKAHRIADNLARGNILASPIENTLRKQARAANEKQTHDFAEFLKTAGHNYDTLFGAGGLYEKLSNVNEKKAVLEFAATKAWLFDLDKLDGHNVYGLDYIAEFGPESFEELVQSHEGGKAKMVKEGVEKVDKEPDVPPIMAVLVHELRHKNIFVVQGIMQRLQDKAKYSHSNTWMLTTLLMLIRDEAKNDPALLKCLDKGMIDNISNYTIQQSAWSLTWLKTRRHEIDAWKRGEADFDNNIVTGTMVKIENRLRDECGVKFPHENDPGELGQMERLDKYEMIAMVLSGKTLHEGNEEMKRRGLLKYGWKPGKRISLFDEQHSKYRSEFNEDTEQASCEPKKTDPDYFNVRNGGSDVMLLNRAMTFRILEKTSTGTWTFKTQAEGFIGQIIDRHEELGKLDPAAQFNFEQEIRTKISDWWNGTDDSRKNQFFANKDQRDRPMWEEFLKRNLLDKRARENLKKGVETNYLAKIADLADKESETKRAQAIFKTAEDLAIARSGGN